jgi:hypothetical protein
MIFTNTVPPGTDIATSDVNVGWETNLITTVKGLGIETTGKESIRTKETSLDAETSPGIVDSTIIGDLALTMMLSAIRLKFSVALMSTTMPFTTTAMVALTKTSRCSDLHLFYVLLPPPCFLQLFLSSKAFYSHSSKAFCSQIISIFIVIIYIVIALTVIVSGGRRRKGSLFSRVYSNRTKRWGLVIT